MKIKRNEIVAYLSMKIKTLIDVQSLITKEAVQRFVAGDIVTWTDSMFARLDQPLPPEPMLVVSVFDAEPRIVDGQESRVFINDIEVIGINEEGVLTNILTDSRFLEKYDIEKVIEFIGDDPPMTVN